MWWFPLLIKAFRDREVPPCSSRELPVERLQMDERLRDERRARSFWWEIFWGVLFALIFGGLMFLAVWLDVHGGAK